MSLRSIEQQVIERIWNEEERREDGNYNSYFFVSFGLCVSKRHRATVRPCGRLLECVYNNSFVLVLCMKLPQNSVLA
jgi:hypothetical protein